MLFPCALSLRGSTIRDCQHPEWDAPAVFAGCMPGKGCLGRLSNACGIPGMWDAATSSSSMLMCCLLLCCRRSSAAVLSQPDKPSGAPLVLSRPIGRTPALCLRRSPARHARLCAQMPALLEAMAALRAETSQHGTPSLEQTKRLAMGVVHPADAALEGGRQNAQRGGVLPDLGDMSLALGALLALPLPDALEVLDAGGQQQAAAAQSFAQSRRLALLGMVVCSLQVSFPALCLSTVLVNGSAALVLERHMRMTKPKMQS